MFVMFTVMLCQNITCSTLLTVPVSQLHLMFLSFYCAATEESQNYQRVKSVLGIFPVLGHHVNATILDFVNTFSYLLQHFWRHPHGHLIHQFCLNNNLFHLVSNYSELHKLSCKVLRQLVLFLDITFDNTAFFCCGKFSTNGCDQPGTYTLSNTYGKILSVRACSSIA